MFLGAITCRPLTVEAYPEPHAVPLQKRISPLVRLLSMSCAEVTHVLVVQQPLASSCGWLAFIALRTASTIAVGIVIPDLAVSVCIRAAASAP